MTIFGSILTTFQVIGSYFLGQLGQKWKSAWAYELPNFNQVKLAQILETLCRRLFYTPIIELGKVKPQVFKLLAYFFGGFDTLLKHFKHTEDIKKNFL